MIQQDINHKVQLYADESIAFFRVFHSRERKSFTDVPVYIPRIPYNVSPYISESESFDVLRVLAAYFAAKQIAA